MRGLIAAFGAVAIAGCAHLAPQAPAPSHVAPGAPQALYVIDGKLVESSQPAADHTSQPSALYIIDGVPVESPK